MENKKNSIEIYEPRKNIIEKTRDIPKTILLILFTIFIIIGSIYSGYYFLKINPDLTEKIFGIGINPQTIFYTKTQDDSSMKSNLKEYPDDTINNIAQTSKTDYSTLKSDLLATDFINQLPKKGKIILSFYNFDSGKREWEKHYILEKNSVREGIDSDADMKIFIDSKYVSEFKEKDICSVIGNAKKNGDFGIETEDSQTSLTWKYKSMIEYKKCLGM